MLNPHRSSHRGRGPAMVSWVKKRDLRRDAGAGGLGAGFARNPTSPDTDTTRAPADLASVEPRSGNQKAKHESTLAPPASRRGSPGLAAATRSRLCRWPPVDYTDAASKPSVPRHGAGGAVLADGRFSSGFQTSGPPA